MARVVVNDCLDVVPNRFDLILLAARRAYELRAGIEPLIDSRNHCDAVIALQEIAHGVHQIDDLEKRIIRDLRHFPDPDTEDLEPPAFDLVDEAALHAAVQSTNGRKIILNSQE